MRLVLFFLFGANVGFSAYHFMSGNLLLGAFNAAAASIAALSLATSFD